MVDIVQTAANVRYDTAKPVITGRSGAALIAGQLCYKSATDSKWYLFDDDAAGASTQTEIAIAMCSAPAADMPIVLQNDSDASVNLGATLVAGTTYVGADAAGGMKPFVDLTTGDIVVIVGIATSAALLKVGIKNTGVGAA